MSDKAFIRSLQYFDVVAALLTVMIVAGRFFVRDSPASPALVRDVTGFWAPLLAVMLLLGFRRRAYIQATP
jgi:hypothetical protein